MEMQWKFEIAIAVWKSWQSAGSEFEEALSENDVDEAEKFILNTSPTTMQQAEKMLDLIAVNVGLGPRCDGLEIKALQNIARFIREAGSGVPAFSNAA